MHNTALCNNNTPFTLLISTDSLTDFVHLETQTIQKCLVLPFLFGITFLLLQILPYGVDLPDHAFSPADADVALRDVIRDAQRVPGQPYETRLKSHLPTFPCEISTLQNISTHTSVAFRSSRRSSSSAPSTLPTTSW